MYFVSRWVQKLYPKVMTRRYATANQKQALRRSKTSYSASWQNIDALEQRVLLSSAVLPFDPVLISQAESVVVAELNVGQTQTSQSAFSADSRAVWISSVATHKMIFNTNGERATYLDFMDAKGVTTVYLFIGNQNPVGNPDQPLPFFATQYAQIISDIHSRGMTAFALIGHSFDSNARSTWDSAASTFGPSAIHFQNVLNYNNGRPVFEQFDGVNLDIEPWTFPEWNAGDKATIIGQYLDLSDHLMGLKQSQNPGLKVGPAAPFFFNEHTVTWRGVQKPANEHVQDVFDYITIQDYRDFAQGHDGILFHAAHELAYAAQIGKPVVLGVETQAINIGGGILDKVTFGDEDEVYMESQLDLVKNDLVGAPDFGGFAIHDFASYFAWAEPVPNSIPLTLQQAGPDGAQIYFGNDNGEISSTNDRDVFTLEAEAGQTLTVVVTPAVSSDIGLTPSIALYVPGSNVTPLVSTIAAGPGKTALLQTVAISESGTYQIVVSGIPGASLNKHYTIQTIINAAAEEEILVGSLNDTLADAQNIDGSFIRVADGVERGAVLHGRIPRRASSIDDFYSFTVSDNQPVTLVLSGIAPGTIILELWDQNGVLQSVNGSVSVDVQIKDFIPPAPGTYYARVTISAIRAEYDLVVIRGQAAFDDESNDSLAEAQDVTAKVVMGYVSDGVPSLGNEIESNDDGVAGISLVDLQKANDLNGSFQLTAPIAGFSTATVNGSIHSNSDQDFFKISVRQGFLIVDLTRSFQLGTMPAGLTHRLLDSAGQLVQLGGPLLGIYGLSAPGDYYLMVEASGPGDYILIVEGVPQPIAALDQDAFHYTADPGQYVTIMTNTPGGALNGLDPAISVLDTNGNVLASDMNSADDQRNARVRFVVPADGQYSVVVEAQPGTAGDYTLAVEQSVFSTESRAVWVWREIVDLVNDTQKRNTALNFLHAKGVDTLYLYSEPVFHQGNFLGDPLQDASSSYASLIADIHGRGMHAFALLESPSAVPFQRVFDYNNASGRQANERFDGINWDYEPWASAGWTSNENAQQAYLDLGLSLMNLKNAQDPTLQLGPVVAHWFGDLTPDLIWNNNPTGIATKPLFEHVLDIYDYATVITFCDTTDLLHSLASNEVAYGDLIGKPVVVGVETTSVPPADQTFFQEGEAFMETVLSQVKGRYLQDNLTDEGFAGYAIKDFDNYINWAHSNLAQRVIRDVGSEWVTVNLASEMEFKLLA